MQAARISNETQARALKKPKRLVRSHKMKPSRRERAIGRETAVHISRIANENKIADLRRELALLQATAELRFHGQIIVEDREDATRTAATTMDSTAPDGSRQLVFFVDGSRFTKVKDKRKRKAPVSGKASGAAVVYQTDVKTWEERTFNFADGHKSKSTEMAAIAEGLAFALSQVLLLGRDQSKNIGRVIIFTDCQAAMFRIERFRCNSLAEGRLRSDPIVRKLVTRSQYLRGLGIEVEIRWVPAHSGVEGNVRADAAARSAAWPLPGIAEGVYLDEGLRMIELGFDWKDGIMTGSMSWVIGSVGSAKHECSYAG